MFDITKVVDLWAHFTWRDENVAFMGADNPVATCFVRIGLGSEPLPDPTATDYRYQAIFRFDLLGSAGLRARRPRRHHLRWAALSYGVPRGSLPGFERKQFGSHQFRDWRAA